MLYYSRFAISNMKSEEVLLFLNIFQSKADVILMHGWSGVVCVYSFLFVLVPAGCIVKRTFCSVPTLYNFAFVSVPRYVHGFCSHCNPFQILVTAFSQDPLWVFCDDYCACSFIGFFWTLLACQNLLCFIAFWNKWRRFWGYGDFLVLLICTGCQFVNYFEVNPT